MISPSCYIPQNPTWVNEWISQSTSHKNSSNHSVADTVEVHYISENNLILSGYIVGNIPDRKVHVANMGPTWVLSAQMGPMLAIWTLLSGIMRTRLSPGCASVMGTMESLGISWWLQGVSRCNIFYCYMYTVFSLYMLRVHMNDIFAILNKFNDVATPTLTINSFNGPFVTIECCFYRYVWEPCQYLCGIFIAKIQLMWNTMLHNKWTVFIEMKWQIEIGCVQCNYVDGAVVIQYPNSKWNELQRRDELHSEFFYIMMCVSNPFICQIAPLLVEIVNFNSPKLPIQPC